jgi:hypothetical protein
MIRQECTEENPCDGEGQWFHPKAKYIEDQTDIYTDWYKCPICGRTFGVTVSD